MRTTRGLLVLPLLLLLAALAGCGAAINHDVTTAVDAATSPAAEKRYSEIAASVVGAARDKALDSDTKRESTSLVSALCAETRAQLVTTRDALLDEKFRAEMTSLRDELLGPNMVALLRQLIREMLDELLGPATQAELATVREEMVGAPLRASADALVDEVTARFTTAVDKSLAQVKADADTEAQRYKSLAIDLGVAAAGLLFALALSLYLVWTHRTLLRSVLTRLERLESA